MIRWRKARPAQSSKMVAGSMGLRRCAGGEGAAIDKCRPHQTHSAMARTVLFLCTGNYYRSRYAERTLQSTTARRAGLDWEATSHALAIERGKDNVGPMARQTIDRSDHRWHCAPLARRGMPAVCTHDALAASDMVVAVKEAEHRTLLVTRFPGWEDRADLLARPSTSTWRLPSARAGRAERRS